jgi:mycothiol S-conjugate amidase
MTEPGAAARRLLFVHAHPDDESSKGAGTAARYVDEGADVVLVTCTGGEAGEILNKKVTDIRPEDLPAVRADELAAAVEAIGFTRTYQLGFHDSGYHEDPADVPEGTFARVPLDEAAARLAVVLREERPHVVVTYPEDGGYPHPDHIRVHAVTMRALELAEDGDLEGEPWRVPKVYACTAFPRVRVLALHEAIEATGVESPFVRWLERRDEQPDRHEDTEEIAARVDIGEWIPRRDAALRAHATQVDPEGFWFQVDRTLERDTFPYECFLGLRDDTGAIDPVDDLFAGLDG